MEYRQLGNTELKVSVLSLGASSLGSVFRQIDETEGFRTVHTAIDLGINFIDVSPYYGLTRAETFLGRVLPEIPRDAYYLATKVGRYGDTEFDFSAARVIASVDESLARMNVEYIDVIQCHDIEFCSLDQVITETIPALRSLQESGKVGYVGITGLPLQVFRTVLAEVEVDTILSYCRYSLNDTSLTELIPLLQQNNVGIISASPLSMGLLTQRGTPDWHPATREIKETCARAVQFCTDKGVDIAKLAVQYSLSNPDIHTTLVGTANPNNIRKNVEWISEALDEELLNDVKAILKPIQNQTWPSGLAENN